MNQSSRFTIITAVFLNISISLFAHPFVPGHLFTVNKDTIAGWICLENDFDLATGCIFRHTIKGKPQKYGLSELSGFKLDNENRTFRKHTVEHLRLNREVFLETIVSGKLELLGWNDILTGVVMYLSEKGDSTLIALPFEQTERYFDDGYTRHRRLVSSTMHQDTLRKYMQDRTDLFGEIESIKVPKRLNLTGLVSKYNNLDVTSIGRAPKSIRQQVSIYVTPSIVRSDFDLLSSTTWDYSRGVDIGLGFHGEKDLLVLSSGFYKRIVHGNPVYQETHKLYRIPLNLEYRFNNYMIQPYISIGIDGFLNRVGWQYLVTPAAGVNIRVIDRLAFTFRYAYNMRMHDYREVNYFEKYTATSIGLQFRI